MRATTDSRGGTSCPECGAGPEYLTPVWESEDKATLAELIDATPEPDGVGCRNCDTIHSVGELLGDGAKPEPEPEPGTDGEP